MNNRWPWFAIVAVMATTLVACGGVDDHAPSAGGGIVPATTGTESAPPCAEGATEACTIPLGTFNGVPSCMTSSRLCRGGEWGECGDLDAGPAPVALNGTFDAGADADPAETH